MRTTERGLRGALLALLLWTSGAAQAFDLDALSAQLGTPAVVRGAFVQEKHLAGLPQPLQSRGHFVLARAQGLLWQLEQPLRQDYRIAAEGIHRRTPEGWQAQPRQAGAARQQRLFLAILAGDTQSLGDAFEPHLAGTPEAWHLRLLPRGGLLAEVFEAIEIDGGALVTGVEIRERQGDRTVLRLLEATPDSALSAQEAADLAP